MDAQPHCPRPQNFPQHPLPLLTLWRWVDPVLDSLTLWGPLGKQPPLTAGYNFHQQENLVSWEFCWARLWGSQYELWLCLTALNARLQALLSGAGRGLRKPRSPDGKSGSAFHKHLFSTEKGSSESHSQELLTPRGCTHLKHSEIPQAFYVHDLGHRACRLSISCINWRKSTVDSWQCFLLGSLFLNQIDLVHPTLLPLRSVLMYDDTIPQETSGRQGKRRRNPGKVQLSSPKRGPVGTPLGGWHSSQSQCHSPDPERNQDALGWRTRNAELKGVI